MGRSKTPKYAIVVDCTGMVPSRTGWYIGVQEGGVKGYGKPTAENLAKYIDRYHESLKPGGSNHGLVTTFGTKVYANAARIVRNDGSGVVVAEWKAPPFMLI